MLLYVVEKLRAFESEFVFRVLLKRIIVNFVVSAIIPFKRGQEWEIYILGSRKMCIVIYFIVRLNDNALYFIFIHFML